MISKFINSFKKTDLDEKNAFRKQVITLLTKKFPNFSFDVGKDSDTIDVKGNEGIDLTLGLTNLKSNFLHTSQTPKDLEDLVNEQFATLELKSEFVKNLEKPESFNDVKSKLILQIMPIEYAGKMPLIQFPLGNQVIVGIAIDDEKFYRYATIKDLETWEVSENEVYQIAETNLNEKSKGIEMMAIPNNLVIVSTLDGFDAARILLPEMIDVFAKNLGLPFYFGIPNRDFLICFAANADDEMRQNISNQVNTDFDEKPYPLSRYTFIVDGKREIKQIDLRNNPMLGVQPNLN
jgi:uncharacterized protein YtpQ (UPF0354 family)